MFKGLDYFLGLKICILFCFAQRLLVKAVCLFLVFNTEQHFEAQYYSQIFTNAMKRHFYCFRFQEQNRTLCLVFTQTQLIRAEVCQFVTPWPVTTVLRDLGTIAQGLGVNKPKRSVVFLSQKKKEKRFSSEFEVFL